MIELIAPVGGSKIDWPARWEASDEAQAIRDRIDAVSSKHKEATTTASETRSAFASSFVTQTTELTKRQFRAQWRDGPYHLTKLASLVFFGMFVGFFFYKLANTIAGIEGLTLSLLVLIQSAAPLMLDIALYYQAKMDIYIGRERNGIYSWTALVTSLLICELPVLLVGYSLMFFCYNWTEGIGGRAENGGLTWLVWMSYAVFTATSGTLLGAVSPSPSNVPFVLSVVWNIYNALSWTLVPHPIMVEPFHSFFSWISPLRWYLGALVPNQIGPLTVTCAEDELTRFDIPATAASCAEYAAEFLSTAAGYLANPDATSNCGYCAMSKGSD